MKAQFILFASNKEELVSKLSSAGYYFDGNFEKLFEQLPWPEPGDDGNNHPWQIVDRKGKPIKARDERFQSGFGLPFQGDAEEVEQLFRALERGLVRVSECEDRHAV